MRSGVSSRSIRERIWSLEWGVCDLATVFDILEYNDRSFMVNDRSLIHNLQQGSIPSGEGSIPFQQVTKINP